MAGSVAVIVSEEGVGGTEALRRSNTDKRAAIVLSFLIVAWQRVASRTVGVSQRSVCRAVRPYLIESMRKRIGIFRFDFCAASTTNANPNPPTVRL